MGDVVRSGSLLPALTRKHPGCFISWLTFAESADLVSANPYVDELLLADAVGLARIMSTRWDYVYSLSNDYPSASFATIAAARVQTWGFTIDAAGALQPCSDAARSWLEMASFDRLKRENRRSWQSVMYDIAECEEPIDFPPLRLDQDARSLAESALGNHQSEVVIGVNVGCGPRWPKKMLPTKRIVDLCNCLTAAREDLTVVLLGGVAEKNRIDAIARDLEANERVRHVGTTFSPLEFAAIIEQCNVLVCGDTLALHLATAVRTPIVALFGPTSSVEIHEYNGLVKKIVAPDLECLGCYGNCDRLENCMSLLDVNLIARHVLDLTRENSPATPRHAATPWRGGNRSDHNRSPTG